MQGKGQPSTIIRLIGLALFIARAYAQIIDAGSATDSNFTGGAAYTISPKPAWIADDTLRFGAFTYDIAVQNDVPYVMKFRFVEPTVQGPAQRVFSVRINNQVVLDRLDVFAEAGYLKPVSRSVIVMGADGHLVIRFEPTVRSAVISAIEIAPLFQVLAAVKDAKLLRVVFGGIDITGTKTLPEWKAQEWVDVTKKGP